MKSENVALLVLSIVVPFTVTIAADRSIGSLSEGRNLIFQRFSRAHYDTPEFTVESRINNLGFRDRDFRVEKSRRFRVMAIGDSFTYGWGIDAGESWPKVLEQRLLSRGYDVEVANLGQPGASPSDYAKIALQAIPLLKPDLVIVGVVQGDDLAQALFNPVGTAEKLKRIVRGLYPNFVEMARGSGERDEIDLRLAWKQQAAELLAGFTPDEKVRFGRIDAEIQSLFVAGQLNPALVSLGVRTPEYFRKPLALQAPDVRRAIGAVSSELLRIRKVSERTRGRVIIVSVPLGIYTSPLKLETYARMGFLVDDQMLKTTSMDEAARAASFGAGLDFYEVTPQFREVAGCQELFFRLDGHFNPAGSRLFAQRVEPIVVAELDRLGVSLHRD
jgi:GDSL-like Lipase/Acylhydrolase family